MLPGIMSPEYTYCPLAASAMVNNIASSTPTLFELFTNALGIGITNDSLLDTWMFSSVVCEDCRTISNTISLLLRITLHHRKKRDVDCSSTQC